MAKRPKKWIVISVILFIVVCVIIVASLKNKNKKTEQRTVTVEKATIVDKALAVGNIEPLNEIAVKSKISGVVGQLYINVGDFVRAGDPLLEVRPDPTPLEIVETKRNLERAQIELDNIRRELNRNEGLKNKGLIADQDFEEKRREYDQAVLNHQIAKERLDLLEKGKVRIADANIETVIKAPITGFILEKSVNVGDPVVPLTSYQAGTELMKMADMTDLIFKGTVDEIDVGKIKESMTAELQIGALPGKEVKGHVSLISLKAQKEDNTTVFPVEITIDETGGAVLRAGFSANANIIIAREDSVLSIPERVVTFRNDSAFVRIPVDEQNSEERYIKTGLSDAITIEVIEGLEEGQKVLEKELHEIT
ncbi:efflux RND transporter periplasmic adaptor subunit [bacterium]|nr:efflux RND transporter periplasmic adaptor subunit [bacterium]